MARILWPCNPFKNTECKKTNCHLIGGPCHHTHKAEYAIDPNSPVTLVIDVSEEDLNGDLKQ